MRSQRLRLVQFNAPIFLPFLVLTLAVHYAPRLPWTFKKAALLAASYLFYAAWNAPFVVLLWISTLIDWYAARGIAATEAPRRRRLWLYMALSGNLGLLAAFKYAGFLTANLAAALALLGVPWSPRPMDVLLPVGISFYTFQTMSYTIDVYLRRSGRSRSFLDYALYVTYFPQLVAGPIVRAADFLPQLAEEHRATRAQFGWGLFLFVLGLFEKNVLADAILAPIVENVYSPRAQAPQALDAWLGTFAFAGQIFLDFAGYSTCAIGIAACFGFTLRRNFHFPYAAVGFSDFWRRWHVSLSTWLRDYLYVPLGGNRRGARRTYVNLMLTMLLGGLWHGASWNFVAWGGLHGLFLAAERLLGRRASNATIRHAGVVRLAVGGLTFLLVCLTWVLFRAKSFDQALAFFASMLWLTPIESPASLLRPAEIVLVAVVVGGILLGHALLRATTLERAVERWPWPARSVVLAVMLVLIVAVQATDRAFIYFQF